MQSTVSSHLFEIDKGFTFDQYSFLVPLKSKIPMTCNVRIRYLHSF